MAEATETNHSEKYHQTQVSWDESSRRTPCVCSSQHWIVAGVSRQWSQHRVVVLLHPAGDSSESCRQNNREQWWSSSSLQNESSRSQKTEIICSCLRRWVSSCPAPCCCTWDSYRDNVAQDLSYLKSVERSVDEKQERAYLLTRFAGTTRIDETSNTNMITCSYFSYTRPDSLDYTGDLMTRYHRIFRILPFVFSLMNIAMTDPTIMNTNDHIVCSGYASFEVKNMECFTGTIHCKTFR